MKVLYRDMDAKLFELSLAHEKELGPSQSAFVFYPSIDKDNTLTTALEEILSSSENSQSASACKRCGQKSVYAFNMQTRRADEGTTVFVMCYKCKFTQRIAG
jgi:DNA-directed RNA polymerase subunit M/transcription elongation factor TFIIS